MCGEQKLPKGLVRRKKVHKRAVLDIHIIVDTAAKLEMTAH